MILSSTIIFKEYKLQLEIILMAMFLEVADENMLAENEIWADFDEITKNHSFNFKIAHINANSIGGFKFYEIKTWLVSGRLDLLVISESKIDDSFPDSMFHVEGFRLCRSDRKAGGGGLMVNVRSDVCFLGSDS